MKVRVVVMVCFCAILGCGQDSILNGASSVSGVVAGEREGHTYILPDTLVEVRNNRNKKVGSDRTDERGRFNIDKLSKGTYFLFAKNDDKHKVYYWSWINKKGDETIVHDIELDFIDWEVSYCNFQRIFIDNSTDLDWTTRDVSLIPSNQSTAANLCADLDYGCNIDWRLPSVSELISLKSLVDSDNKEIKRIFSFQKTRIPYRWTNEAPYAIRIEETLIDNAMDECIEDYVMEFIAECIDDCDENNDDCVGDCESYLQEEGEIQCNDLPLSTVFGNPTTDLSEYDTYAVCVRNNLEQ